MKKKRSGEHHFPDEEAGAGALCFVVTVAEGGLLLRMPLGASSVAAGLTCDDSVHAARQWLDYIDILIYFAVQINMIKGCATFDHF